MTDPNIMGTIGKNIFHLLARELAPYLRTIFASETQSPAPEYYDQTDSPLGRRKHLDLARRGVLNSHKIGRRVLVKCADVQTFIESKKRTLPVRQNDDDDILKPWGVEKGSK